MGHLEIPPEIGQVRDTLWAAGRPAYPVGGCVRDQLLGRTPGDYDMTTAARPEEVMALFRRTVPTGLKHGTVTVLTGIGPVEVTTFRREGGYSDSRHPDAVAFDATLEEDLARRDFTVNAMALDRDGTVVDPFGGQADLAVGRIRCVGDPEERFSEDALRMLRAVRFAAQLGFRMEPGLVRAVGRLAPRAAALSAERVRTELEKTICSPRPGGAEALFYLGLLERYGPGPVRPLEGLGRLPAEPLARWAGLCGALDRDPEPFLTALRLEGRIVRACGGGFRIWRTGLPEHPADWRRALADQGTEAVRAAVWMAFTAGEDRRDELERTIAQGGCRSVKDLPVTGGELAALGWSGPAIGAVQRRLLDHVLERPEDARRDHLLALLERWKKEERTK